MGRSDLAQAERQALCDLLLEVGPDHPTLCEGWQTSHLAAHLVTRDRNFLAGPGLVLGGPFARYTEGATERKRTGTPYEELVAEVRKGPPFPVRLVDGLINVGEYFVHHEDVRRAAPQWEPRQLSDEMEDVLWGMQGAPTKLMVRRLRDVALTLRRPDGSEKVIGTKGRKVTMTGPPSEILLFLFGRRGVAQVELEGDEGAIEELRTGPLGV